MAKKKCTQTDIKKCLARRVLCICSVILNHPIFKNTPREKTHELSNISDLIRLKKSEKLFLEAASLDHVYFVIEGSVKIYNSSDTKKELIHEFLNEGDAIALEALFSDLEYMQSNAECLEDSTILLVDKKGLRRFLKNNPEILYNLIKYLSERVTRLTARCNDFILKDVSYRLDKFLVEKDPELEISKANMAYHLGTIPETLSRALKRV